MPEKPWKDSELKVGRVDAPGWTPGPWRVGPINYADIYSSVTHELVALVTKGRASTVADASLIVAVPDLYEACSFVKSFLTQLEDGTEPGDPLRDIRRKFHAPLHAVLDAAMAKARPPMQAICPKCKGIGAPWNNSASVPCTECEGTGRVPA